MDDQICYFILLTLKYLFIFSSSQVKKKELEKKVAKRIKQTEEFNLKETRRYPVSIFLFVGWGFFFFNPNLEGK